MGSNREPVVYMTKLCSSYKYGSVTRLYGMRADYRVVLSLKTETTVAGQAVADCAFI